MNNDDYIILSTVGHIKDLPTKKLGVNIDKEKKKITIDYETIEKKSSVVKSIQKVIKDISTVYLATDPDREGEIISLHAREIIEEKAKKKLEFWRVTFNEITKEAVQKSIKEPREINFLLISAQQARRVLDRWVGYMVSPLLWKNVRKGLSAGRVQSVALKLICIRENEILSFVIEEYWSIHPMIEIGGYVIESTLAIDGEKKIPTNEAERLKELVLQSKWNIKDIKESEKIKRPSAPFITSTLQQEAYHKLGFSVQKTMSIAQNLYEGLEVDGEQKALITYMRTDSTRIAQEAVIAVRLLIKKHYGAEYLPSSAPIYSKKQAQDAHEAIRPISVDFFPEAIRKTLSKDHFLLYELIWKRFVSCQMENARYKHKQVIFSTIENELISKATHSVLLFDGYKRVYSDNDDGDESEGIEFGALQKGDSVKIKECVNKKHFTAPPSRYNEASLVKELEQKNIGRPSTYATIMRTICDRLYTELDEKKRFFPTELGKTVATLLDTHFSEFMNVSFTANMEENLDKIARGELLRDEVLSDFYFPFEKKVTDFKGVVIKKTAEKTDIKCPESECGGMLVIRSGKKGQFLGCSLYPKCGHTAHFIRDNENKIVIIEAPKLQVLEEKCPECGAFLCSKSGRYGSFFACSNYPKCNFVKKKMSKNNCPGCKKNPLMERRWKGRTFWGCSSYPTCSFVINGNIREESCESCGGNFFRYKKDDGYYCITDGCEKKLEE